MSGSDGNVIALVCAADDRFGMPLAVMLRSAADNLAPEFTIRAFVIDGGIAPWTKRRVVRSLDDRKITVRWVRPDLGRLRGVKVSGHVSIASYFRILIPDLLPESCGKAIYLDSDVVVEGDLSALWRIDVSEHPFAAVQDMVTGLVSSPLGLRNWEALGLPSTAKYFNAGVLLVNVDRWRAERIGERVLAYLAENPEHVRFWDQDGLNAVLAGRWLELDPRWNLTVQSHVAPREEHRAALAAPFVTHFLSASKPWHVRNVHPRRAEFFRYLDRTRWAGWRPSDSFFDRARSKAERAVGRVFAHLAARGWAR